jgi:hypothetical protein
MTSTNAFTDARVEFSGTVWDLDHKPHEVFKIERVRESTLYGDYFFVFPPDDDPEFNIEIGLFGYPGRLDAGNPDPTLRERFTADESRAVEQLIRSFFLDPNTFAERFPPPEKCVGISFRPNWIVRKTS